MNSAHSTLHAQCSSWHKIRLINAYVIPIYEKDESECSIRVELLGIRPSFDA